MSFLTPQATGELPVATTYVLQQLAQLRSSAYGLSDEQIHATPSASDLSIAALLRHAAQVAVTWSGAAASAPECPEPDPDFPDEMFDQILQRTDSAADLLAYFDDGVARTRSNLESITDLDALVPVPQAPWYPPDLTHWQVRWVLAHVVAELARHIGHADVIRETIDGKTSYELNARADGHLADDEEFHPYG